MDERDPLDELAALAHELAHAQLARRERWRLVGLVGALARIVHPGAGPTGQLVAIGSWAQLHPEGLHVADGLMLLDPTTGLVLSLDAEGAEELRVLVEEAGSYAHGEVELWLRERWLDVLHAHGLRLEAVAALLVAVLARR